MDGRATETGCDVSSVPAVGAQSFSLRGNSGKLAVTRLRVRAPGPGCGRWREREGISSQHLCPVGRAGGDAAAGAECQAHTRGSKGQQSPTEGPVNGGRSFVERASQPGWPVAGRSEQSVLASRGIWKGPKAPETRYPPPLVSYILFMLLQQLSPSCPRCHRLHFSPCFQPARASQACQTSMWVTKHAPRPGLTAGGYPRTGRRWLAAALRRRCARR